MAQYDLSLFQKNASDHWEQVVVNATASSVVVIGAGRAPQVLSHAEFITALGLATDAELAASVSAAVAALVDSSPATLDTLNELAAALGNDANFAATVTAWLAQKAPLTRTISAAGLASGGGTLEADRTITVPAASQAEAQAGIDDTKAMTPLRVAEAIAALAGAESINSSGLAYVATHGDDITGDGTYGAPFQTAAPALIADPPFLGIVADDGAALGDMDLAEYDAFTIICLGSATVGTITRDDIAGLALIVTGNCSITGIHLDSSTGEAGTLELTGTALTVGTISCQGASVETTKNGGSLLLNGRIVVSTSINLSGGSYNSATNPSGSSGHLYIRGGATLPASITLDAGTNEQEGGVGSPGTVQSFLGQLKVLGEHTITLQSYSADRNVQVVDSGTMAFRGDKLSAFASTTSAELAGVLSDALGTGKFLRANGTIAVATGKTATINNTITLNGTDGTTMTLPSTNASLARIDAAQSIAGIQTFTDTSAATAYTNGAMRLAGGLGVTGQIYGADLMQSARGIHTSSIVSPTWWLQSPGGPGGKLTTPSDGIILMQGASASTFNRLQFGGTSSSFVALQTNGTTLTIGTADGGTSAGNLTVCGTLQSGSAEGLTIIANAITAISASADKDLLLTPKGDGYNKVPLSKSSETAKVGGGYFDWKADVASTSSGMSNTTEDTIFTRTIPANGLGVNNVKLIGDFTVVTVAHATATRKLKLYFAGTAIMDTGSLSTVSAATIWLRVFITRVNSSTVRCSVFVKGPNFGEFVTVTDIGSLNFGNSQDLTLKCLVAGTGSAAGDVTGKHGFLQYLP